MPILYIETNFLMGYSTGREARADDLFSLPTEALNIALPDVCVMEMHSAFERERARRNRFNVELDQQIGQLRRDVLSATSAELLTHLGQARILNTDVLDEMQARSARVMRLVAGQELGFRGAELLPLTPACLDPTFIVPEVPNQPTDSLILRVISEHAARHPDEEHIFLSANVRDFRNDLYVAEHLDDLGLRFFADTGAFLGWFQARP